MIIKFNGPGHTPATLALLGLTYKERDIKKDLHPNDNFFRRFLIRKKSSQLLKFSGCNFAFFESFSSKYKKCRSCVPPSFVWRQTTRIKKLLVVEVLPIAPGRSCFDFVFLINDFFFVFPTGAAELAANVKWVLLFLFDDVIYCSYLIAKYKGERSYLIISVKIIKFWFIIENSLNENERKNQIYMNH